MNKYFQNGRYIDSWVDISDYMTPTGFIKKVMGWMNSITIDKEQIEGEAYAKFKKLLLNTFPYVSREQTSKEKEKIRTYLQNGWDDFL